MKSLVKFVIMVFAVFRLTELITRDDGPYNIFARFRLWAGKRAHKNSTARTLADLVTCPYCLSVWLSFIILLLPEKVKLALGIAGAVSLIKTIETKIES